MNEAITLQIKMNGEIQMSNNKVKSVSTSATSLIDNINADDQAKLFAALAAKFQGTPMALAIEKELHESNVATVSQRVKEIDSRVNELRAEINTRNEEIKSLLTEKASLGIKVSGTGERTRAVTVCAECGQGRHADNEKTRGCKTYAAAQAAKKTSVAVEEKAA